MLFWFLFTFYLWCNLHSFLVLHPEAHLPDDLSPLQDGSIKRRCDQSWGLPHEGCTAELSCNNTRRRFLKRTLQWTIWTSWECNIHPSRNAQRSVKQEMVIWKHNLNFSRIQGTFSHFVILPSLGFYVIGLHKVVSGKVQRERYIAFKTFHIEKSEICFQIFSCDQS